MIYLWSNFRTKFPRNAFFDWDVELSPNKLFLCTWGYEKGSWMSMPDMLDVCQCVCVCLLYAECLCLFVAIVWVSFSAWIPGASDSCHVWSHTAEVSRLLGRNYKTHAHTHTVCKFFRKIFKNANKNSNKFKLTTDVVPDWPAHVACCVTVTEWKYSQKMCWDGQIVYSNSLDSGSNVDKRETFVIEGYVGNIDSSRGNAAEHGTSALPQHPLEGEHFSLLLCLGSCRPQSTVQSHQALPSIVYNSLVRLMGHQTLLNIRKISPWQITSKNYYEQALSVMGIAADIFKVIASNSAVSWATQM